MSDNLRIAEVSKDSLQKNQESSEEVNISNFQESGKNIGEATIQLNEKHRKEFHDSGISDKTIRLYENNALLKTIEQIEKAVGLKVPKCVEGSGWIMFYPNSDSYYTLKADKPRVNPNGRTIKYENPYGQAVEVFIPLGFDYNAEVIIITEGIKKAIKAVQEGFNAISISGVWNWRSKKSKDGINASFSAFIEKVLKTGNKTIYLCFDNDVIQKESVKMALTQLSVYLLNNGVIPKVIKLPYNKGQKLGLDGQRSAVLPGCIQ